MRQCMAPLRLLKEGDPSREELLRKAADDANTFHLYFRSKRIFFNKELCELIDSIFSTVKDAFWDFTKYPLDIKEFENEFGRDNDQMKERRKSMEQAWIKIGENEFPKTKSKLEDEFRELLGVNLGKLKEA